jgi:hypothetical protein
MLDQGANFFIKRSASKYFNLSRPHAVVYFCSYNPFKNVKKHS